MISYKPITRIVAMVMAFAVCLCICAVAVSGSLAEAAAAGIAMEYESKLFHSDKPIRIDLQIDADQWQEMLDSASEETYFPCDVEIDGTAFYRVGIRPKGNTSLRSIANDPTTDRYSFKLEFDQYVDGQTCYGLDKLILNNNYADATNRKEALIYDMYRFLDADASLCNYAEVYVNGEYWGVYLALEAVEDSFLLRNYGVSSGELYKPENMDFGGGGADRTRPDPANMDFGEVTPPMGKEDADTFDPSQGFPEAPVSSDGGPTPNTGEEETSPDEFPHRNERGGGGFGAGGPSMGSDGANLNYIDDDLDSYSTIWEGEVKNTSQKDHKRVVTALKNIAEGNSLETYMDVDNLLKYMAVHVFSVNEDSLSGMMAHNYYLYEENGRLNVLPWDYNLALGGMGGDAESVVNDPIDTPFSGTEFFDTLLQNETYLKQYHAYLKQLVEQYVNGGGLEEFYRQTSAYLDPLVKTDPTAFYSFDEYTAATDMLYKVVQLRAESISGQLDGSIPATESGQKETPNALLDASSVNLTLMGTMNSNRQGPGSGFGRGDEAETQEEVLDTQAMAVNAVLPGAEITTLIENASENAPEVPTLARQRPDGGGQNPKREPTENEMSARTMNSITYGACLTILLVALLVGKRYRRKPYRR